MPRYKVDYSYLVSGDSSATVEAINEDEALEKAYLVAQGELGLMEDFYGYEVTEVNAE